MDTQTKTSTATVTLECGHTAPTTLFRLTPRQAFYGYTMGDNVHDMLVTCPTCRDLVTLKRPATGAVRLWSTHLDQNGEACDHNSVTAEYTEDHWTGETSSVYVCDNPTCQARDDEPWVRWQA